MNKNLKIFYHLFTENYWKEIFQSHLESIIDSELYNSIESMMVYVIWKKEEDLQKAIDICQPYSKIKVRNRNFSENIPFDMNHRVCKIGQKWTKEEDGGECFEIQLAEGETLLKVVDDAKKNPDEEANYLYLHSKGSSSQCISRQKNKKYEEVKNHPMTGQTEKGLQVVKKFVFDWKWSVEKLETHNWIGPVKGEKFAPVYGTSINMWWATSSLLKKFDMQKFLKWQYYEMLRQGNKRPEWRIRQINRYNDVGEKIETFYNPQERHAFTFFPYKIEQSLTNAQGGRL